MYEGQAESSMPAALQALHLTIDLYGVSSVQLVAPYLILAEAALGKNHPYYTLNYQFQLSLSTCSQCSRTSAFTSQLDFN